MLILVVLGAAAFALIMALSLDGILPRAPLEKLVDFPFKGAPATNGVTLAFAVELALLAAWVAFRHISP
jgi:hypothetical protein